MNRGEVYAGKRTANLNDREAGIQWEATDWYKVEQFVNKVQTRIAKAAAKGNRKLVRELQRMLTHSHYAKLWAIRKVTGARGKRTTGIDKERWESPAKKYRAVSALEQKSYRAKALKRVYIPKANGKMRPLSIPTMTDRAMQTLQLLALDPVIESTSDKHSFGFRKERSCQDAREQLFAVLSRKNSARWIVEGDIKACFDEIAHEWLVEHTPMDTSILKQFLKAGYVERGQLFPTEHGTPQGGAISPTLANHTLNGMETLLYKKLKGKWIKREDGNYRWHCNKVNLVRYADDFIITAESKEIAEQAKEIVRAFLEQRGLQLSETKTVITTIDQGFDFLGWNFRKYGGKLLIKPSKTSQKKLYQKIRETIKGNRAITQDILIALLNPVLDGWSNYHQGAAAKRVFSLIDHLTYRLLWKWARSRHHNKGRRWIKERYWKTVGNSHWVFMDPTTEKALTLRRMSEKRIIRHPKLKLDMNPYIDRVYFLSRHTRLLINRRWGNNSQKPNNPNTKTGTPPPEACLHEA